jgi:hypothetical protein
MPKDKSLPEASAKISVSIIAAAGAAATIRPPQKKPTPMTDAQTLQAVKDFIGTTYSPAVKEKIKTITHRPVIGPGDFSTREFNPNRINLHTNAKGMIEGCRFG